MIQLFIIHASDDVNSREDGSLVTTALRRRHRRLVAPVWTVRFSGRQYTRAASAEVHASASSSDRHTRSIRSCTFFELGARWGAGRTDTTRSHGGPSRDVNGARWAERPSRDLGAQLLTSSKSSDTVGVSVAERCNSTMHFETFSASLPLLEDSSGARPASRSSRRGWFEDNAATHVISTKQRNQRRLLIFPRSLGSSQDLVSR